MTKKASKRIFSHADKEAHRRLRAIWDDKKRGLNLTQEKVAADWGRTQGLVTQYLNGIIPLGPLAVLRFSRILEVQPTEIRPDFEFGNFRTDELDQEAIDLAVKWSSLPPSVRQDIKKWIETTQETGYASYIDKVQPRPSLPKKAKKARKETTPRPI